MDPKLLFEKLTGTWEGLSRTWFEPDKLADESVASGQIEPVMNGRFLRHSYQGTIQGKPRQGEELIAFNSVTGAFEVSWIDSFHMNYAIMFSEGHATPDGFVVRGKYDVGEGHPRWGWKTELALQGDDSLTITAYNVDPDANEARAVETCYRRTETSSTAAESGEGDGEA